MHNILKPSQSVFAMLMLCVKQGRINFIFCGLTRPGTELTIYRNRFKHVNYYTIDAVYLDFEALQILNKEKTVLYLAICRHQLLIWWFEIEFSVDAFADPVFATIKSKFMATNLLDINPFSDKLAQIVFTVNRIYCFHMCQLVIAHLMPANIWMKILKKNGFR